MTAAYAQLDSTLTESTRGVLLLDRCTFAPLNNPSSEPIMNLVQQVKFFWSAWYLAGTHLRDQAVLESESVILAPGTTSGR